MSWSQRSSRLRQLPPTACIWGDINGAGSGRVRADRHRRGKRERGRWSWAGVVVVERARMASESVAIVRVPPNSPRAQGKY